MRIEFMTQQKQGIYEFYDFQLDIGKGVLLRDGQPVTLQWKTFELLCVLVKSNGNLITRDELMNELWAETFVEDNNLSQHIRALRRALGENGNSGAKFIETVPRRGYRFLSEVRLNNFTERETVPIAPENLSIEFLTSSPSPNNLSVQFTTPIGREREVAELSDLLRRTEIKILTLTGVGGTGKTTLAQAVAREALGNFQDGVFFIELAAITNP